MLKGRDLEPILTCCCWSWLWPFRGSGGGGGAGAFDRTRMIVNDRPATSEQSLLVSDVRVNFFSHHCVSSVSKRTFFFGAAQNLPS